MSNFNKITDPVAEVTIEEFVRQGRTLPKSTRLRPDHKSPFNATNPHPRKQLIKSVDAQVAAGIIKALSVRIPKDLYDKIKAEAFDGTDRPNIQGVVIEALELYVIARQTQRMHSS